MKYSDYSVLHPEIHNIYLLAFRSCTGQDRVVINIPQVMQTKFFRNGGGEDHSWLGDQKTML